MLGINPVVDPPDLVLEQVFQQARKAKGPIPVRGTVNGVEFTQTLVKYQAKWRLYINGEMLGASCTKVGDEVEIEMEFDSRPREVPMPPALAVAFERDERAKIAFGDLTPSRQKEIFRYIGSLKTNESIQRNVEKILRQLKEGIIEKPLVAARGRGKS